MKQNQDSYFRRKNEERIQHLEKKRSAKYYSQEFMMNEFGDYVYRTEKNKNLAETVKKFKRFTNKYHDPKKIEEYVNWLHELETIKSWKLGNDSCVYVGDEQRIYLLTYSMSPALKMINKGIKHLEICHNLVSVLLKEKPKDLKIKCQIMVIIDVDDINQCKINNSAKFVFKI